MGTPRKINAILLNIKTNQPKLASMCKYKLATYTVSQKKTSPTFLAITPESIDGFL